jgi:hypothetical protein
MIPKFENENALLFNTARSLLDFSPNPDKIEEQQVH